MRYALFLTGRSHWGDGYPAHPQLINTYETLEAAKATVQSVVGNAGYSFGWLKRDNEPHTYSVTYGTLSPGDTAYLIYDLEEKQAQLPETQTHFPYADYSAAVQRACSRAGVAFVFMSPVRDLIMDDIGGYLVIYRDGELDQGVNVSLMGIEPVTPIAFEERVYQALIEKSMPA